MNPTSTFSPTTGQDPYDMGAMVHNQVAEKERGMESGPGIQVSSQCESIRSSCRTQLERAALDSESALTEKDVQDYMKALTDEQLEMGGATSEETKMKQMQENLDKYIPDFIKEAKKLGREFLSEVENAYKKDWISHASAEKWRMRMKARTGDWLSARTFMKEFNGYKKRWEALHKDLTKVEKHREKLKLDPKASSELAALSAPGFADQHYLYKRDAVSKAQAWLIAFEKKQPEQYKKAEKMLKAAVTVGALSPAKVGIWMLRIFKKGYSHKEIDAFLNGRLDSLISNWTKVAYRFDRLERSMKGLQMPQGMKKYSKAEFLMLEYPQRVSYLDEVERRLKIQNVDGPPNKPIDDLKLRIRHALDTKDWEEAEELIQKGFKIAQGEDVHEIQSMNRYLKAFKPKEEKLSNTEKNIDPSVRNTLESMRGALGMVPGPLRGLYLEAMESGYDVFACLMTMMYNRVWCRQHGYLSDDREANLRETAVEDTKKVMEQGHGRKTFENISLDGLSGENQKAAIPEYNGTRWGPTVLHYKAGNKGSLVQRMKENKGSRSSFAYWTTILPEDVNYSTHQFLVTSVNWILKSGMRKLHKAGYSFTTDGPPRPLG